jgi:hypothetical protein
MFYSKQRIMSVIALLSFCSAHSMQTERALFVPNKLGNVALYHDDSGFKVLREDGDAVAVQPAFMDKELRGLSNEKLVGLVKAGGYLKLNQFENDGEYSLKVGHRLNGGGLVGAYLGSAAGYFAVNLLGQGIILCVSAPVSFFATPAAGVAVHAAMSKVVMPLIQPLAWTVGTATGVAAAVATGPV